MTFVSITPDGRETAEQFLDAFGVPWPCVYGAPRETLQRLGAISTLSGRVAPTLYVLGRDGTVTWDDRAARYRHQPVDASVRELQRAVEGALRAGS